MKVLVWIKSCTLAEAETSAPQNCQKCGVCIHAVST